MSIMISYDFVSCRKICKESYKSGDLRDTETLTAGEDDTSLMASSVGRVLKSLQEALLARVLARALQQLLALILALAQL